MVLGRLAQLVRAPARHAGGRRCYDVLLSWFWEQEIALLTAAGYDIIIPVIRAWRSLAGALDWGSRGPRLRSFISLPSSCIT